MIEPVEPKPEYRSLAEDTVLAAVQDPDPANPIAVEVARLIAAYTSNFKHHFQRWAASHRTSFASSRAGR